MPGLKHLIECHCVLPIYKNSQKIINHKFPVYSKIDEKGNLIEKLVKCNNCDALHLVKEVCRSEIKPGKDDSTVTTSIKELSYMLTQRLSDFLIDQNADYATWEQIIDIIEEERWNESAVIKREIIDEKEHVKLIEIYSEDKFKIRTEVIESLIIGASNG